MLDADGTIRYVSPSIERVLGYKAEEVLGTNAFHLAHRDDLPRVRELFETRMNLPNTAGRLVEVRARHKDDSWRHAEVVGRSLTDESGLPYMVMSLRDITEKKELELQFLRAQRVESIGTLAGGIAHDLNNILTPISMSIPILRQEINSPSALALLESLEESARRGANMVQQILTFSRGIKIEKEPVQTRNILKEFGRTVTEIFPKSITFKLHTASDLWPVRGNVTELQQALMNLCINARDAMPKGGTLTVTGENINLSKLDAALIPNAKPGSYVVWVVADTGEGIPPEHMGRIFDPFFSTKPAGKGTGLGLSTTVGIIRGHDGCIQVQSKVGKGTAFKIYLPATTERVAAKPIPLTRPLRGNGQTILVVDDEDAIRRVTEKVLTMHNYRVLSARNGAEAVEIFANNKDAVQLILLDVMMPVMDSQGAVNRLRAVHPGVKIIASSSFTSTSAEEAAAALKVDGILTKPFAAMALLESVRSALAPK